MEIRLDLWGWRCEFKLLRLSAAGASSSSLPAGDPQAAEAAPHSETKPLPEWRRPSRLQRRLAMEEQEVETWRRLEAKAAEEAQRAN